MRILKEYKLCQNFYGAITIATVNLPTSAKVIEAYPKGNAIYILAAINPSESWLIEREFKLFKVGAELPQDEDLKATNICGLVQIAGLSPILILECPIEEIPVGDGQSG